MPRFPVLPGLMALGALSLPGAATAQTSCTFCTRYQSGFECQNVVNLSNTCLLDSQSGICVNIGNICHTETASAASVVPSVVMSLGWMAARSTSGVASPVASLALRGETVSVRSFCLGGGSGERVAAGGDPGRRAPSARGG